MGKRGVKPKGKVEIEWSSDFAYAIGLLATDGNLSSDGRHISFVSKDKEQIINFNRALRLTTKISKKARGSGEEKKYYFVQFSDVLFCKFLLSIGFTPAKSKTLGVIAVPKRYYRDFLRGVFDGDGYTYSYWDKRWRSSFMFYVGFVSASITFVEWLRSVIFRRLKVRGHITTATRKSTYYQLKYAKKDGLKVIRMMYYRKGQMFLSRKYLKIKKMLAIVGEKF